MSFLQRVLAMGLLAGSLYSAALTPGNIVVYRVGDGGTSLSGAATTVFLDEYTTSGTLVQSIAMPTSASGANRALTASGTATSEGYLTRSANGQYLVVPGYDAASGTATVASTAAATVNRVVGRVAADGIVDTSTALTDASGNIRSATSSDGTGFWTASSSVGVRYATFGAAGTSTQISTTVTNVRNVAVFGGQLYVSSSSGAIRVATVGSGLPVTTGQTITNLPGFPTTGSPTAYLLLDLNAGVAGDDTLYVAEDTTNAGIQKYSLVGGSWVANGSIAATGARGLTGSASGSTVTLYFTSGGASNNALNTLTDSTGYNATIAGTVTAIAAAGTNRVFRGVAFAPVSGTPTQPTISINSVSLNEGNSGTTNFNFTVSLTGGVAGAGGVSFNVAAAGVTATAGSDFQSPSASGSIAAGQTSTTVTVAVNGDTTVEPNETFTVTLSNVIGALAGTLTGTGTITNDDAEVCGDAKTLISTIQGSGATSPMGGSVVSIEGIVVGDFQGSGGLQGYYLQEPDSSSDGNPATSEGIFVFDSVTLLNVSVGDRVRVRGTVGEFTSSTSSLTQLTTLQNVLLCSTGNTLPTPVALSLPVADATTVFEAYEGMRVQFAQTLTVTDNFTYGRFGELDLATARLIQFTQANAPSVSGYAAALADGLNQRILLDDASGLQNVDPIYNTTTAGAITANNTVRLGSTVTGLAGVMDHRFGRYRIQPVSPVLFTAAPRPASVPVLGGRFKVAFMNLLNYFNGDGLGGGFPTPRGADSLAELNRQQAKTVAALIGLNAHIVAVSELENDGDGSTSAAQALVNAANAATAPGTWDFIRIANPGGDEIRNGILYKPAFVTPVGTAKVLDATVDPNFNSSQQRPSVAQRFQPAGLGVVKPELQTFYVVVNHLKSKGSSAGGAGDADAGDGQGLSNGTRTRAAQALAAWIGSAGFDTQSPVIAVADRKVVLVGDFNAYLREDPITALLNGGLTNLSLALGDGALDYSYLFQAYSGSLDHALVSPKLLGLVSGYAKWHINADEPTVIDYNVEFKSVNQQTLFYEANAFRSADHDPLVVGLNPLCGDLDDDGDVDATDQALIRAALGRPGVNYDRRYDFDGSGGKSRTGTISLNDFRLWAACSAAFTR